MSMGIGARSNSRHRGTSARRNRRRGIAMAMCSGSLIALAAIAPALPGLPEMAADASSAQDVIDAFDDPSTVGGTLTLTADVTVPGPLTLDADEQLSVDLAGHRLTVLGNGGDPGEDGGAGITNDGVLTFEDGRLEVYGGGGGGGAGGDGAVDAGMDGDDGRDGGAGGPAARNSGTLVLDGIDAEFAAGSGGGGGNGGDGGDADPDEEGGNGGHGGNGGDGGDGLLNDGVVVVAPAPGGSIFEAGHGGPGGDGGAGGAGSGSGGTGASGYTGVSGPSGTDVSGNAAMVTFDGNGADGHSQVDVFAANVGRAGSALGELLTAWPIRTGHTFDGWYDAASGGSEVDPQTSVSGQTVFALWESDPTCDAATFATDFNGAGDGDTVTLCGDVTIEPADGLPLSVDPGTSITLDLDGNALDVTGGDGEAGLGVPEGAGLTIVDGSTMESAHLIAQGGDGAAGIGGGWNETGGTIRIVSGTVEAYGGSGAAGIGGGSFGDAGTITIDGGSVTAHGEGPCSSPLCADGLPGVAGAGIGGGTNGRSGLITINGGTVEALGFGGSAGIGGGGPSGGSNGGEIVINGGDVTATGGGGSSAGAGIGSAGGRAAGPVYIRGGTVVATGGARSGGGAGGAGIGTGADAHGSTLDEIRIEGGHVTATGGGAANGGAGVGGGSCSNGGIVIMAGGATVVDATGGPGGAGIGGGSCDGPSTRGAGGDVTIGTGPTVTVASSDGGNPIGHANGSTEFGTLDTSGDVVVDSAWSIPADATVTNHGVLTLAAPLTNAGTIDGTGALGGSATIDNAGAIWHSITVGGGLTVLDHHHRLVLDLNGGVGDWQGRAPWSIVDGPSLESVGRTLGDLPAATRSGHTFTGWNTEPDGTGETIAAATVFTGSSTDGTPVSVPLYAQWESDAPPTTTTTTTEPVTTTTTAPATTTTTEAATTTTAAQASTTTAAVAPASSTPQPPAAPAPAVAGAGRPLPATGAPSWTSRMGLVGLVLLIGGVVIVRAATRRTATHC